MSPPLWKRYLPLQGEGRTGRPLFLKGQHTAEGAQGLQRAAWLQGQRLGKGKGADCCYSEDLGRGSLGEGRRRLQLTDGPQLSQLLKQRSTVQTLTGRG